MNRSPSEVWNFGFERAKQAIEHINQENDELCEPYSQEETYMFWRGFEEGLRKVANIG